MYLPRHFEQTDERAVRALAAAHPLAMLVTVDADGRPCADHVPLLWEPGDGHGVLRGHVARANPLWRRAGSRVLAVFQGPDAYVSPGWYPSKAVHGKVVPTWNYAVVHLQGVLHAIDDAGWLQALLRRLTAVHEDGRAQPWHLDDAPADYLAQTMRAIVGIEIPVEAVQAKWKVSQNRDAADRDGVRAGLAGEPGEDARAMAAWVPPGGETA